MESGHESISESEGARSRVRTPAETPGLTRVLSTLVRTYPRPVIGSFVFALVCRSDTSAVLRRPVSRSPRRSRVVTSPSNATPSVNPAVRPWTLSQMTYPCRYVSGVSTLFDPETLRPCTRPFLSLSLVSVPGPSLTHPDTPVPSSTPV